MKCYPKWFSAYFIFAVIFVLFVTGLFLAPTTLELRLSFSVPWRLKVENRTLMAAAHALAGFLVSLLIGSLGSIHMRHVWRRKILLTFDDTNLGSVKTIEACDRVFEN